ncbi:MAG TPA: Ig-like domain-containing protein, partial [Crocinitomicaceae bacterium]|nr:Ig-like domain-containing protein [Crocinitomicaceae bacterium]
MEYFKSKLKAIFLLLGIVLGMQATALAQCGFVPTCPNTDYLNFGIASKDIDVETLEYDNFTAGFHASTARTANGTYEIWGQNTHRNGTANLLSPTVVNATNYPGLTGDVLKVHIGSSSTSHQMILLTTDGLWAWGTEGIVIANALTSSTAFQKLNIGGQANGLPAGVTPLDVKMMFVTNQTIAITTCNGDVYVLTQQVRNTGTGITSGLDATKWYRPQVETSPGVFTDLTNIIHLRGQYNTLFALQQDPISGVQKLYTWGTETYLGDNSVTTARATPTEMNLPDVTKTIKMIGCTRRSAGGGAVSYYVLSTDGNLYTLGNNQNRQLGDFTTSNSNNWIQPTYTDGGAVMDNIHWISPQEHDPQYPAINVLTKDSTVYSWGSNNNRMIGRGDNNNDYNPGMPGGITMADRVLAIETGGHTSMLIKKCESYFGYVGHRIAGSMGDGTNNTSTPFNYTFATSTVFICGATSVSLDLVANAAVTGLNGLYCNGETIRLEVSPSPGTLSILSGPAMVTQISPSEYDLMFGGLGNTTIEVAYEFPIPGCPAGKTTNKKVFTEDCDPAGIRNERDTTLQGGTITGNSLNNDVDPNSGNNTTLTVTTTPVRNPTNGSFTIDATGNYTYTPTNSNWSGTDMAVVSVCNSFTPQSCVNDTIFIVVLPISNETAATQAGTPVTVDVTNNDGTLAGGTKLTVGSVVDSGS